MKTDLFLKFDNGDEVNFKGSAGEDSVTIHAAEQDKDGKDKPRTFSIKAYNGREMFVDGFHLPVVLDLAGMTVTKKNRPILLNHDPKTPVGHSTSVEIGAKSVQVKGTFSYMNAQTQEMIDAANKGFPWQASVGARVTNILRVAEGETAVANGHTFKGPILIAKKSKLKETSFVPLGADDSTSIKVAANQSARKQQEMEFNMFEEWLKACGLDSATLSEDQIKKLEAQHALTLEASASNVNDDVNASESKEIDIAAMTAKIVADVTASVTNSVIKSSAIEKICESHPEIKAQALKERWNELAATNAVELANIRAGRPSSEFAIHVGAGSEVNASILECGLMQASGARLDDLAKSYDEKTVAAADKQHKGRLGLAEMFVIAAHANGYNGTWNFKNDPHAIFASAMGSNLNASSGFSTVGLGGILGNTGNKFFKNAFNHIESTWRGVSAIGQVSDFKTRTTYSLTADMTYKRLAKGGKIEHGTFGEESYTNKANTYARMGGITREDLINDDLGAFMTIMQKLGKGAADAFNLAFWTEFMDNSSFFTAGNDNVTTGSAFGIDEVTAMETVFLNQTNPDGTPYGAEPRILLVPNALNTAAKSIVANNQIVIAGDTDTKITNDNPHAGNFEVVRSSYLSNSTITGNSSIASYMLSKPVAGALSAIETVFLQGQETPTIEQGDVDFNQLGVQMRGFHDFGMNKQEYREGVRSAGV